MYAVDATVTVPALLRTADLDFTAHNAAAAAAVNAADGDAAAYRSAYDKLAYRYEHPSVLSNAEPRFVAAQLRCSYFEFDDRGHFSDCRELPEVAAFIQRKLER